jgi:hypothetical protein
MFSYHLARLVGDNGLYASADDPIAKRLPQVIRKWSLKRATSNTRSMSISLAHGKKDNGLYSGADDPIVKRLA